MRSCWLFRGPLKAQGITIRIVQVQLLHAIWRNLRFCHLDTMLTQVTMDRIHVRRTKVQASVAVCYYPDGLWVGRTILLLVSSVQHYFSIVEPQQSPVKLIALARRSLDHFEPKHVAIKTNRRRHVEDLQQNTNATNVNAHESFLSQFNRGQSSIAVYGITACPA